MTNYYNLLVGDSEQLDLYDVSDFQIDLSFFLVNPERLDQRGGVASNTFKIPATKNNNRLFQHFGTTGAYDAAVQNFNKLKNVSVVVGGLKVAEGFLRGKSYGFSDKPNYYEVMFLGGNKDWSDLLAETKLIDLPFPTVDWNKTTVENSWDNIWSDCYTAPMVNYGRFDNVIYDGDILIIKANDFRYWHFAKWIVIEMFKKIGWKIDGTFINDAEFERFITYHNDLNIYADKVEGDSIDIGYDLISQDRTCLDYLKGVVEFFNLYFIPDFNTKTITIEQFNQLISTNEKEDWTEKLDLSKDNKFAPQYEKLTSLIVKLKPDCLSELMQFKFNESISFDFAHKMSYSDAFSRPYATSGGEIVDYALHSEPINDPLDKNEINYFKDILENEGAEERKVIENSYFTGTFMGYFAANRPYNPAFPINSHLEDLRMISMLCVVDTVDDELLNGLIYSECGFGSYRRRGTENGNKQQGTEPRIAYYAGMKKIQPFMRLGFHFGLSDGLDATDSAGHNYHAECWKWYDDVMNTRPYAYLCDYAHEDGGKNFLLPNQTVNITGFNDTLVKWYYPQETIDMQGLFEREFIKQLYMTLNGRNLSAYFKLKEKDIANLDFRKLKTIEHRDFMLYEVNKWNVLTDLSTNCLLMEYIKIKGLDYLRGTFPNHILFTHGQNFD